MSDIITPYRLDFPVRQSMCGDERCSTPHALTTTLLDDSSVSPIHPCKVPERVPPKFLHRNLAVDSVPARLPRSAKAVEPTSFGIDFNGAVDEGSNAGANFSRPT